jgi:galactose mutarotase-like enzyme
MSFTHRFDESAGLDRVEGPGLSLAVRRRGAEAISLVWQDPRRGPIGLLWRDGEIADPPRFWKSHAPILFPIVGGLHDHASRATTGEEVRFRGLHGFVRHEDLALAEAGPRGGAFLLNYRLEANDTTRALYPWEFVFEVTYLLFPDRLEVTFAVENRDSRPMPFQVGWHPGFATPLVPGAGDKAACHVRLPARPFDRLLNDDRCFLTGQRVGMDGRGDFPFNELGLDLTYMFDLSSVAPADRAVTLLDPDESFGVRVAFPDFPHLGLWSDAGAPFVCIEPWHGMDDHVTQEPFDRKLGIVLLPPGGRDARRASIEVLAG